MEGQYACTIIFDEYFKTIGVKYCYFKHTFTKKNEKKDSWPYSLQSQ